MALGECRYMTCRSMLGSAFRARFHIGGKRVDREVLLCSAHERECREIRDSMEGWLGLTPDGNVYSDIWMESLVS